MSYTTTDGDVWCCEKCYKLATESTDLDHNDGSRNG